MFLVTIQLLLSTDKVSAFDIHTGYYVGNGVSGLEISGLGFEPELLIIRRSIDTGGGADWVSSTMPGVESLVFGGFVENGSISLETDGFTVSASVFVNNPNTIYYYVAFGGSDCSASGHFCVGTYNGDGTTPRSIPTGFAPDYVTIQGNNNTPANFSATGLLSGVTTFYNDIANDTSGNFINSLGATGFEVGVSNNQVNVDYSFFAFRELAGKLTLFAYNAPGTTASLTGLPYEPSFVIMNKLTGTLASRRAVFKINETFGNSSGFIANNPANAPNHITSFNPDGFTIGTSPEVNETGASVYSIIFGGASPPSTSGDFEMAVGSYVGNGTALTIDDLDFEPDYIFIKSAGTQQAVYRTKLMANTFFTADNTGSITNGVTSFLNNGFTVGNNAAVNANGTTYHWQAFGNAYNPITNSGSENFSIGAYFGNGLTNREVQGLPTIHDMVFIRSSNTLGIWRNSTVTGNNTYYLRQQNTSANRILDLLSNGFLLGTNAEVNANETPYWWVSFKNSSNFNSGNYTGQNSGFDITAVSFQPDLVWAKGANTSRAVSRPSSITGVLSQRFNASGSLTNRITALLSNGFSLGTDSDINENAVNFIWSAWNAKRFSQANYRFFENADSTLVGTPLSTQNTPAEANAGDPFRLRLVLDVERGNLNTDGGDFKLQFAEKGTGSCSAPEGSYADVGASTDIRFFNNSGTTDKDALTPSANDPTSSNTVISQSYIESNNFSNNIDNIFRNQSGQFDFSLASDMAVLDGTEFCFRVVQGNGSTFNNYDQYPEVLINNIPPAPITATGGTITQDGDYKVHTFTAGGTFEVTAGNGPVEVLVVGGGGGGGTSTAFSNAGSGGGGAGGLVYDNSFNVAVGSYSVTVGSGGSAGAAGNNPGNNGGNSSFDSLVALGGGGGAGGNMQGLSGGSGGGSRGAIGGLGLQPGSASGGFGNDGGSCPISPAGAPASGGGGAGSAGGDSACNVGDPGTDGGEGLEYSISGTPIYYAGGGGGGAAQTNSFGNGGLGGGGNGGNDNTAPTAGAPNTGGGGGGGNNNQLGAVGGSGVVIVRYFSPDLDNSLSFTLSDNAISFAQLTPSNARYATNDLLGSDTDSDDAHTFTVSTNAHNGYSVAVNGASLTCSTCGPHIIQSIGDTAVASAPGSEQFGMRIVVNSGNGTATSPYDGANWAFDAANMPSTVVSGPGDDDPTEFGVRYIANISAITPGGIYETALTYIVTAVY